MMTENTGLRSNEDAVHYGRLHVKNRDRIAEIENHIDEAEQLYRLIAKQLDVKKFHAESFVGINGSDMAVIETSIRRLLAMFEQWQACEYRMDEADTFCVSEPAFVEAAHSVCDPENEGRAGECLTGDSLRRNGW
jgi:hypothetical protein